VVDFPAGALLCAPIDVPTDVLSDIAPISGRSANRV